MPALERTMLQNGKQCGDQETAGGGPGKADRGIDPETETARYRFSSQP
jgi:hypothetical protein